MVDVAGWLWCCPALLAALCGAESCCDVWLPWYVAVVLVVDGGVDMRWSRGVRGIVDQGVVAMDVVVTVSTVVVEVVMMAVLLCCRGRSIAAAVDADDIVVAVDGFGFGPGFV